MNDLEYSKMRLDRILSAPKLNLNPYELSDEDLIKTFNWYSWSNSFEIADCVILNFKEVRQIEWINAYDALVYTIGSYSTEDSISINRLLYSLVANDSKRMIYPLLDGNPIQSKSQAMRLVGKRVLVSHCIDGTDSWGNSKSAFVMHTLFDDIDKDARIIRIETLKAKIHMLQRLLLYPECSDYLNCDRDLLEIEKPVKDKIEQIKNFSK